MLDFAVYSWLYLGDLQIRDTLTYKHPITITVPCNREHKGGATADDEENKGEEREEKGEEEEVAEKEE